MAAIGTGNTQPGVVTASLGTSGTLFAFSTVPIIDPQGEVAAFCDSTDNWLLLICTLNLTLVTEHVRNLFGWEVCLQSGEGVGLGGAIQAGWFGAMNRDRVPRWRKSARGSYRQSRPRATNLMPMQARSTPTL
jgi:xylulokinase